MTKNTENISNVNYQRVLIEKKMHVSREAFRDNVKLISMLQTNSDSSDVIAALRKLTTRWMVNVVSIAKASADTRDTSIQVFDKFVAQLNPSAYPLNPLDRGYFSAAAAASIVIASKIHDPCCLGTDNFPYLQAEHIIEFERTVLLTIKFEIVPQATPATFIRDMLWLWPEIEKITSFNSIVSIADKFVGEFWEDPVSLRYAPSTIAIAALILTFSELRIGCTNWLNRLPDACLMPQDQLSPRGRPRSYDGTGIGTTSPTSASLTSSSSSSFSGDTTVGLAGGGGAKSFCGSSDTGNGCISQNNHHHHHQEQQGGGGSTTSTGSPLFISPSFYSIEDFPYLDVDSCFKAFQHIQQLKRAPPPVLPTAPLRLPRPATPATVVAPINVLKTFVALQEQVPMVTPDDDADYYNDDDAHTNIATATTAAPCQASKRQKLEPFKSPISTAAEIVCV